MSPALESNDEGKAVWVCDECSEEHATYDAAKQCEEDDKDARLRTS